MQENWHWDIFRRPDRGEWVVVALLVLLIGTMGAFRPFQPYDWLQYWVSAQTNIHSYSGNGAVVAIDENSIDSQKNKQWTREDLAILLEKIGSAKPASITIERQYFSKTDKKGIKRLANSIAALPVMPIWQVEISTGDADVLATGTNQPDPRGLTLSSNKIDPELQGKVIPAGMAFQPYPFRAPLYAPSFVPIENRLYPSIAMLLAEGQRAPIDKFPVDISIDPNTIPLFPAHRVLRDDFQIDKLAGRQVVIGFANNPTRDAFATPIQTYTTRSVATLMAAQTLIAGPPVIIGWIPAFMLALVATIFWLVLRRPYGLKPEFWIVLDWKIPVMKGP
jgi:CHASE2 domain-containing sensor protein